MRFATLAALAVSQASAASLTLTLGPVINTVDARYVNFNIDTGSLYNGMDFSDPKFRTLVSQLAQPYSSIIRVGGTAVDSSYYFPAAPYLIGQPNVCSTCGNGSAAVGNIIMDALFDFALATNMSLLVDVNGKDFRGGKDSTGPWDVTANTTALLAYLDSKYGGSVDFAYSVGNEPDLWKKADGKTPLGVPLDQLARDALSLKKALTAFNIGKDVYGSAFAGITTSEASGFLPVAAAGGVTGYTCHAYPYGGKDCTISKYLDKTPVTQGLHDKLAAVRTVAAGIPGADRMLFVLEETACSSGGGCENVTDRFLAGWAWMMTLNTVGAAGFSRLHRQDIAGWSFAFGQSHYQLLGPAGWTNGTHDTLTPHPDYYTTLLFKQLVGTKVLATTASGDATAEAGFAGQFWCARAAGSVVLAWANLGQADVALTLPAALAAAARTDFIMTATASGTTMADLQSDAVYLNGALLTVDDAGRLPAYPIAGAPAAAGSPLTAPKLGYGFAVFEGVPGVGC